MKIEFIDKSLILENGIKFTFGMTKSEVAKLLKGYKYSYSKTYLIYPKKVTHLDETYQYEKLGNIRLRYLDDSLFLFHIPVKSNELFFENVNLLNEDYKYTMKQLNSYGYVCHCKNSTLLSEYSFSNTSIELIVKENKLWQVTIPSQEYKKNKEKEEGLYYAKMSRDEEDNVVIRYTRIKK